MKARDVTSAALLPLLCCAVSACAPKTINATAFVTADRQGRVVMVRTERDVAQRFSEPGRQIYIGLGECAKGEAGLIFNQAVARASSEPSQQVVFASEPFGADVSPRPPLCALLKTASMSPVAKHYRSRLLRLRQVR